MQPTDSCRSSRPTRSGGRASVPGSAVPWSRETSAGCARTSSSPCFRRTMPATLMDGAALAARLREEIKQEVDELGHVGLATVLVGDDPASEVYIRLKHKAADAAGMEAIDHRLPVTTSEDELVELVRELNADGSIDGILVQTPLPDEIDEARVMR